MKTSIETSRRHDPAGPCRATALYLPVAVAIVFATAAKAEDAGDPSSGRRLASAWCVNCHVLDDSKDAIATGAPSFKAIAANSAITPSAVQAFLRTPHRRMPDLDLSNSEVDDLIAYVLSSRPQ